MRPRRATAGAPSPNLLMLWGRRGGRPSQPAAASQQPASCSQGMQQHLGRRPLPPASQPARPPPPASQPASQPASKPASQPQPAVSIAVDHQPRQPASPSQATPALVTIAGYHHGNYHCLPPLVTTGYHWSPLGHHWLPLIGTTGQNHWSPPLVTTTSYHYCPLVTNGRYHWSAPLVTTTTSYHDWGRSPLVTTPGYHHWLLVVNQWLTSVVDQG